MSRLSFEDALADHREAIDAVVRAVREVDPRVWTESRASGKWAPADVAEHLALSYGPPLSELDGGPGFALRVKGWKLWVVRRKYLPAILERGVLPSGASSPREARPVSRSATPDEAGDRLSENASRFERRLTEARARGEVRLTHAYFGSLTGPEILRILAVHARHHRVQLPGGGTSENSPRSFGKG
jgi:hypothetical protein